MSKTDIGLVLLNLFAFGWGMVGLTAQHLDPLNVAVVVSLAAALTGGAVAIRRGRSAQRNPDAVREASADELDARTILDLDARLEALERAQADAADAAKWRALVESGQVRGPAPEAPADAMAVHRQPLANGR